MAAAALGDADLQRTSLKAYLRKRILEDMIGAVRQKEDYCVMVMDTFASRIVSSACRMYDVMGAGVLAVEKLEIPRERVAMPGLYFLTPSEASVRAVIKDFEDPKRPQYSKIYLYFSSQANNRLMQLLASSALLPRLANVVELNADFVALEGRAFTCGRPRSIKPLYMTDGQDALRTELARTSQQLVSLCISCHEFPYIRHSRDSRQSKYLAKFLDDDLKKAISVIKSWRMKSNRGTILIVDRASDLLAPLMHDFTYQPLLNDTLEVRGELVVAPPDGVKFVPPEKPDKLARVVDDEEKEKAEYKKAKAEYEAEVADKYDEFETEHTHVLSEDDSLWADMRHQHFSHVRSEITRAYRDFRSRNALANLAGGKPAEEAMAAAAAAGGGGKVNARDLRKAIDAAPEYQLRVNQFHKHLLLYELCKKAMDAHATLDVADLEQDMACGVDENSDKIKVKKIKEKLGELAGREHVPITDKLRLMMLFLLTNGALEDKTRRELIRVSNINLRLEKALTNLRRFGVNLTGGTPLFQATDRRREQARLRSKQREDLRAMRFAPFIEETAEQFVNDTLSREAFPFIGVAPPDAAPSHVKAETKTGAASLRKGGNWRTETGADDESKGGGGGDDERKSKMEQDRERERECAAKPMLVVFVLGGMTFSEMRAIYSVAHRTNTNLFIGGSDTVTAKGFIASIADLEEGADVEKVAVEEEDV